MTRNDPARPAKERSDPSALDDDGLMIRVAQSDQRAFAVLIDRHLTRTIAMAARVTGSSADGEEVAQEAFTRVWLNAPKWQPGTAKFSTWLYRITMNLCIDRQRRRGYQPLEDAPEQGTEGHEGFDNIHQDQLAHRVRSAVDALPDLQRRAMILCNHEGLSNAEAAEILETSVKAIESLLVRARRSLRAALRDTYEEVAS